MHQVLRKVRNCFNFKAVRPKQVNKGNTYFRWIQNYPKLLGVGTGGGVFAAVLFAQTLADSLIESADDGSSIGENNNRTAGQKISLQEAIIKSRDLVQRVKDETGSPGLVVGVSVDGDLLWTEGFGYSDVENRVPCSPDSVLRIASISKSITMVIVAKLWESGKLDLDAPIQKYVPDFPEKTVQGEKVVITARHLLSHLSGIRHYDKHKKETGSKQPQDQSKSEEKMHSGKNKTSVKDLVISDNTVIKCDSTNNVIKSDKESKDVINSEAQGDAKFKEFYLKKKFSSVDQALRLFKDDPLFHQPGSKFLYTTHGWTVVSAVAEGASGQKFPALLQALFKDLGLQHTYLDENDSLIYNRARYYMKNKKGRLINAPYVDNSYKWAGGGLLSTVGDLIKFSNVMLYSYQRPAGKIPGPGECRTGSTGTINEPGNLSASKSSNVTSNLKDSTNTEMEQFNSASIAPKLNLSNTEREKPNSGSVDPAKSDLPGYLRADTVQQIWTPVPNTLCDWDKSAYYGMGWAIVPEKREYGFCRHQQYFVSHTGGAIGASSVLLILPKSSVCQGRSEVNNMGSPPQGVSIAMIANTGAAGLYKTAMEIAQIFEQVN